MHKVTSAPGAAGRIGVCLCKRLVGKQRRHLRVSWEGMRHANLPSRALNHNVLAGIWLIPSSLQVSAPGSCAAGSGSSALPPGPGCSRIWGTAAQQILTASGISSAGLAPCFFQGMNSRCMYPKLSIYTQNLGAWPSSGCVPRAHRVRCEAAQPTPRSSLHPRSGTHGLLVARGSQEQVPSSPKCSTGPPLTRSPRRTGSVPCWLSPGDRGAPDLLCNPRCTSRK